VKQLAKEVGKEDGWMGKVAGGRREEWVDVMVVCQTSLHDVEFTKVPPVLRTHWSK
jgi:hypothetical protein